MSRKKGFDFSGIVMIAVFLGLYYGSENIDWFKTTDSTSRGIVLLICALILFLIVKTIFSIKNGFSKGVLIQNVILLVAAAAFIGIALLLKNTNISDTVLFIPWIGIPVVLMLITSEPGKKFISKFFSKKDE